MPFMRGARLSPRAKLAAAVPFREVTAAPPEFARVAKQLSIWGNDRYGDCVSAEEAYAKVADAPNVFIDDNTVINWARQHGYLNGADLTEVMDAMKKTGMAAGGKEYKDGPNYNSVDWTDRQRLCDAIYYATVKIAVDATPLENAHAGGHSGWFLVNAPHSRNIDHCVSLTGYGSAAYLYQSLGMPVPGGVPADAFGYLLFTWNSVGFIDEQSMRNITAEAWVRHPTTAGYEPMPTPPDPGPQPGPTPTPTPTPTPSVWSKIIAIVIADMMAGKSFSQIITDIIAALFNRSVKLDQLDDGSMLVTIGKKR